MRKRVVLVLAALSLLTGLFVATAPPAAADSLWGCTPYNTLASVSSSGHRLSTQGTVCLNYVGPGSLGTNQWEVVNRFKCYRDGVLFGNGTGGCRWDGSQEQERVNATDTGEHFAVPGSSSSSYWSDSDRIYGARISSYDGTDIRGCLRGGRVHFMGTTGIDYGLFNMADIAPSGGTRPPRPCSFPRL